MSSFIASLCTFGAAFALAPTNQAGMPAEVAVAAGAAAGVGATVGINKLLDVYSDKQEANEKAAAEQIVEDDQLVIIFDDLDRCYPDRAIHFLATVGEFFHEIHPKLRCNLVIACDPEVLARHAAHVFGISLTEGLESITKYIHAPLNIPIGFVNKHREAISHAIPTTLKQRDLVIKIVCGLIGIIPIRELLASLPQFIVWLNRYYNEYQPDTQGDPQRFSGILLLLSVVSINVPSFLRYLVKQDKDDSFASALQSLFAGVKQQESAGGDMVLRRFGPNVVESIAQRPDIIHASKVLGIEGAERELVRVIRIIGAYAK